MSPISRAFAGALALGLAAAPALSATTYDVELTQTGLGDAGPDWFGTVTVEDPTAYGAVGSFSITVAGIVYDSFVLPNVTLTWSPAGLFGSAPDLFGIAAPAPFAGAPMTVLWFSSALSGDDGVSYDPVWGFGSCYPGQFPIFMRCSSGDFTNTLRLIEQPATVPLPASGALALAGLAGLAALRRRAR